MSGTVTLHIILQYSRRWLRGFFELGSMARNAPAVMIKATGVKLSPCTQPMPVIVVMLSGAPASQKRPAKIGNDTDARVEQKQPAHRHGETGNEQTHCHERQQNRFARKSVRSTNHAAGRPNKNDTASAMSEKPAVFQRTL